MAKFDLCVCGLSRAKKPRRERGSPQNSSGVLKLNQDLPQGILRRTDQRDPWCKRLRSWETKLPHCGSNFQSTSPRVFIPCSHLSRLRSVTQRSMRFCQICHSLHRSGRTCRACMSPVLSLVLSSLGGVLVSRNIDVHTRLSRSLVPTWSGTTRVRILSFLRSF